MARAVFLVLLALLWALPSAALGATPTTGAAQRWIVQLEPGASTNEVAAAARSRVGVTPGRLFSHVLNGFAATMTSAQRDLLAADPRVRAIVPDREIRSTGDPYPLNPDEVQSGIRRVGATHNELRDDGPLDVDIAVLDTGIQPDNDELNVVGGFNCTDPTKPTAYGDVAFFGHGTHVAGIAAARHNGRGVAGVAQGARLWAIKVLAGNGNGYWSWVICGLDRVAQMQDGDGTPTIEVVNMSLAAPGSDDGDCGRSNTDLLHQAVCRVNEAGVTMIAAAGNFARDAAGYVPGAYDEVITVSATADWNGLPDGVASPPAPGSPPDECERDYADDAMAGFSDFGADVDLIAPGTCVLSTLPFDRLGLMTGTSMATPHVAGAAALYYLAEEAAGRDRPTPEQVRAALVERGTLDWLTATDGDRNQAGSRREPALFAGDFDVAAFFEIGARRQVVRAAAGSSFEVPFWIARVGGFSPSIGLAVDGATLPAGAGTDIANRTLSVDLPANAPPGSYQVAVTGTAGSLTQRATFRLVVFNAAADAGSPVMSLRSGVAAGTIAIPVRVSWPSVANTQRYRVARSVDGGDWVVIANTTGVGVNVSATPGVRYQYRVRARVGGVWREWRTGRSAVVTVYEPGSVQLAGSWQVATADLAYSELPVYSTQAGASATLSFTGRSVGWIGARGPGRGRAQVRVDGSLVTTIDTYADSRRHRVMLFATSWASVGNHSLSIGVTGQPTSRRRVDVEAMVVITN